MAGAVAAVTSPDAVAGVVIALVLLGLGWSLAMIAGSRNADRVGSGGDAPARCREGPTP